MPATCVHDWRRGPMREFMSFQMVCLKCWEHTLMRGSKADRWPSWAEEDYWNNLDRIEGDMAPEIRRMREAGE